MYIIIICLLIIFIYLFRKYKFKNYINDRTNIKIKSKIKLQKI